MHVRYRPNKHRNPNRTEGCGNIHLRHLPHQYRAACPRPPPESLPSGATQTSLFRGPVVYESAIHANFAKCMAAEFMQ